MFILFIALSVTLLWDPNVETDLAGYKVYWGVESGKYTSDVTVPGTPTEPTYVVQNLLPGQRYYFAVTAYNTQGMESGFSNEVTTIFPPEPATLQLLDVIGENTNVKEIDNNVGSFSSFNSSFICAKNSEFKLDRFKPAWNEILRVP